MNLVLTYLLKFSVFFRLYSLHFASGLIDLNYAMEIASAATTLSEKHYMVTADTHQ